MNRSLVVGLLLFILPFVNKVEAACHDSLDSSVYADRRAKVSQTLRATECALIFSGTYQFSAPNLAVPRTFQPNSDFYYLTGAKLPNSVLVVFSKKIETNEGLASDFLFLPGSEENPLSAMGFEYQGRFGKVDDSLLVCPISQFSRFVIEILDADQVEHIQTLPLDPCDHRFSNREFSQNPSEILFGSMAPFFYATPEVTRFYQEIKQVKYEQVSELVKKVLSWLKYHQEVPDQVLRAFSEVRSEAELDAVKSQITQIKFDFFHLRKTMDELRLVKSAEERRHLARAGTLAVSALRKAVSFIRPGAYEREIQGVLELEVYTHGGRMSKATQVISGKQSQAVLYAQNTHKISKDGTVVIDLGVKIDSYSAHIARTFPPEDRFSNSLRKIYHEVSAIHLSTINGCVKGVIPNDFAYLQQRKLIASLDPILLVDGESRTTGYQDNYIGGEISSIGLEINEANCEGGMDEGMVFAVTTSLAVPNSRKFKLEYQGVLIRLTDIVEVGDEKGIWLTRGMPLIYEELASLRARPSE